MGPRRIVCLTEEPTETLYALGEQDRIVGISGFTVRPPQARKEKPKVSAFTSAKIGEILKLQPDLAIGFSDIQADIAAELVRRGVEVWISNHRSVDGILLPFQMKQKAAGMEFTITLESVRHNADLPANEFALPDAVKALLARQ